MAQTSLPDNLQPLSVDFIVLLLVFQVDHVQLLIVLLLGQHSLKLDLLERLDPVLHGLVDRNTHVKSVHLIEIELVLYIWEQRNVQRGLEISVIDVIIHDIRHDVP